MVSIGILADTHMMTINESFTRHCALAFAGCEIIFHAGDLCDTAILSSFTGKEVHAVCGNMCNTRTKLALPDRKHIVIEGYSFGLTHGTGPRHNIEERIFDMFPDAGCIVYGHTHIPACHIVGKTLYINPGSFQSTDKYGATGTYGLINIDGNGLQGSIHSLPGIS